MDFIHFPLIKDSAKIFMICLFPISIWALFIFFHDLPAYIMHYPAAEIAGILAYILAFALLESILVAGILVLIASITPKNWFLDRFITQGAIIILITSLWWIVFQFWYWRQRVQPQGIQEGEPTNLLALGLPLVGWFITYLLALAGFSIALQRSRKMDKGLQDIADRFVVPSTIFLVAELISMMVIVFRNWL